jgi:low affinity Fe/Cu permease
MTKLSYSMFSQSVARASGRPLTFALVVFLTAVWALTGPLFDYSDTWQLSMNTVSSIITFLMVFVIQNTQNRQGDAVQIKLDELIRVTEGAQNTLLDLEELEAVSLEELRKRYVSLARRARNEPA